MAGSGHTVTTVADLSHKHVVICNERLVFRFGVDRILLETARTLVERKCRVTIVCLRCDEDVVRSITQDLFIVETVSGDLYDYEAACARYLESRWNDIAAKASVDAILSGGWPFFHVASLAARRGVPSIFIDAGSVPHDDLSDGPLVAQRAVRRLRALFLPGFDRVLPISRFIEETQTVPDRGSRAGVQVIHLGVDHLAGGIFADAPHAEEDVLLANLRRLASRGVKLVLGLGRFEARGYKNSAASFSVLRDLLRRIRDAGGPDVHLLLLAREDEITVPSDLDGRVTCLGSPGDTTLVEIMKIAEAGFSPSLWEGFNLPIGEMQILGKPVFAFNVGAHPEVILHPWFLCASIDEAAEKMLDALAGRMPDGLLDPRAIAAYRERFSWTDTLAAYRDVLAGIMDQQCQDALPGRILLIDVTNASRDTANSGVIRVTRRLSAELQSRGDIRVFFVYWDAARRDYSFVTGIREDLLAGYNGPAKGFEALIAANGPELTPRDMLRRLPDAKSIDARLLIAEVVLDGDAEARIDWAKRQDVKTAAILYDLIPMEFPQYVGADLRAQFAVYLDALPLVDDIISISSYSLQRFRAHMEGLGRTVAARAEAAWLPGQFAALPRAIGSQRGQRQDLVRIVCVSTIEPRKNHRTLLAAFKRFRAMHPDTNVRLCLVGNYYREAEQLADEIRQAVSADASIEWRVAISDHELTDVIQGATFTVYPSLVEGFGLPILESLWMGKPVICHEQGVMAELAAGGGCLTVDMNDETALATAMRTLIVDRRLCDRLAAEARSRAIARWSDYARTVAGILFPVAAPSKAASTANAAFDARVRQDASYLRNRLGGLGALANVPAPEPRVAPQIRKAPVVIDRGGLAARLFARSPSIARLVRYGDVSVRQVRASGLFDAAWYLDRYPDVREAGLDPVQHFARWGHREARSPGPDFDSVEYFAANPVARESGLSAFAHYLKHRSA